MSRPFRFAVQAYNADSGKEWRDLARRVEALGYSALHTADHYLGPGAVSEQTNHPVQSIAAVPAMAVAAEVTERIRVGCRVFCVDYRPPAVLAKEAATLDLFSDGRLELGLGAGWVQKEYEAMGLTMDPAGRRVTRLEETVQLVKDLMGDGQAEMRGKEVTFSGWEGVPKPVQRPHPPIMIGGGSRRVLGIAGAHADIVSFNFDNSSGTIGPGVPTSTEDTMTSKLDWVRAGAGDRFDQLELEIGAYFTVVTDDARGTAEGMGKMFGLDADATLRHPHALIGSVDGIVDELERRREAYGISYVTVGAGVFEAFAPVVERLSGS